MENNIFQNVNLTVYIHTQYLFVIAFHLHARSWWINNVKHAEKFYVVVCFNEKWIYSILCNENIGWQQNRKSIFRPIKSKQNNYWHTIVISIWPSQSTGGFHDSVLDVGTLRSDCHSNITQQFSNWFMRSYFSFLFIAINWKEEEFGTQYKFCKYFLE